MPVVLPASFAAEIERPWGAQPTLWLVEIEIAPPVSGPTPVPALLFRICNRTEQLTWPVGDPIGVVWHPFPFAFSKIEQTQEGDLPQIELAVDNTQRTLMRYLHDGGGLEGNSCRIYLVPANSLAIAYPNHEYELWTTRIALATARDDQVQFRLEHRNFFHVTTPGERYSAHRCRWEFGNPDECGYVVNEVAAFQSCPRTPEACEERGEDHRARGLPVLHPRRFGAFPGIPRQR